MKLAYLCLAHDNFQYLTWLSEYLTKDNDGFFVHIDRRVDLSKMDIEFCERVRLLPEDQRVSSRWGTFEIVEATLNLLEMALNDKCDFDSFVLISGHDYPLYSASDLKKRIKKGHDYISLWEKMETDRLTKEFRSRHYYYINFINPGAAYKSGSRFRIHFSRFSNFLISLIPVFLKRQFKVYGKGSQWWCLSRSSVSAILKRSRLNMCDQEFRFMHAPDEKFFQTLYLNEVGMELTESSRCQLLHGLHYIDWKGKNGAKLSFKLTQKELAKESGALFSRKILPEEMSTAIKG